MWPIRADGIVRILMELRGGESADRRGLKKRFDIMDEEAAAIRSFD